MNKIENPRSQSIKTSLDARVEFIIVGRRKARALYHGAHCGPGEKEESSPDTLQWFHLKPAMLTWQCLPFDELSTNELYAILKARQVVFVVEQNCPFLDTDDADQQCRHLSGWQVQGGNIALAAYARLVPPGIKYREPSIGRVITLPEFRGQGLGKELMARATRAMNDLYPDFAIRIGAQQYLERFYSGFGFVTASPTYIEDGIPHVEMVRPAGVRST
jgi:ElaA protein